VLLKTQVAAATSLTLSRVLAQNSIGVGAEGTDIDPNSEIFAAQMMELDEGLVAPDHRNPLEIAVAQHGHQGGIPHGRTTRGIALRVTPDTMNQDELSGCDMSMMADLRPGMVNEAVPVADFSARFNDPSSSQENETLLAQILSNVYAYQEAHSQREKEECRPSLKLANRAAMFLAVMSQKDYHRRMRELLMARNTLDANGKLMLSQPPLPSVPLVKMTHIKQFLEPPNVAAGQRQCSEDNNCIALTLSRDNTNIAALGPLQTSIGNPATRLTRDTAANYILREFLTPKQLKENKLPAERQMCFVCTVYSVSMWHHSMQCEGLSNLQSVSPGSVPPEMTDPRHVMYDEITKVRHQLDSGSINTEEYNAKISAITQRADKQQLRRKYIDALPFKVVVGPGEFPRSSCIDIRLGDQDSTIVYPFPLSDVCEFSWIPSSNVEGVSKNPRVIITFPNF
jgi:hypothetical protein